MILFTFYFLVNMFSSISLYLVCISYMFIYLSFCIYMLLPVYLIINLTFSIYTTSVYLPICIVITYYKNKGRNNLTRFNFAEVLINAKLCSYFLKGALINTDQEFFDLLMILIYCRFHISFDWSLLLKKNLRYKSYIELQN